MTPQWDPVGARTWHGGAVGAFRLGGIGPIIQPYRQGTLIKDFLGNGMLRLLSVTNFATIEQLEIELAADFNVLTGETGAGKSIIVDAVSLLLGGRADAGMVRAGGAAGQGGGCFPSGCRAKAGGRGRAG